MIGFFDLLSKLLAFSEKSYKFNIFGGAGKKLTKNLSFWRRKKQNSNKTNRHHMPIDLNTFLE